jgi:APA family basic amino acid/polyamine antiporter
LYDALNIAAGVALFSFIGVETAAIVAGRVRNPRRNVSRAALLGTGLSAVLYVAVTAAVMGLVPHDALVGDGAPFVAAYETIFNGAGWAGKFVALVAVISGIGALNGWTLVTAEMPYAAAKDGLFLHRFTQQNRRGAPSFGIVASTIVASALMGWSYSSQTGLDVFTDLVYLSVVTVAIPYFIAAAAQFTFLVSRRRRVQGWAFARDMSVAVVGLLFSLWVTFSSGYAAVYQALLLVLVGIPLYGFLKARRERLGQIEETVDMPPEMADAPPPQPANT